VATIDPTANPAPLALGVATAEAGELVVPGSTPPPEGTSEVHYHLPVHIEVRSAPTGVDMEAVADQVLLRLARGIANT